MNFSEACANKSAVIVLNTFVPPHMIQLVGMMSYPNFGGPLKHLKTPDVELLASLVESGGGDLRIAVQVNSSSRSSSIY